MRFKRYEEKDWPFLESRVVENTRELLKLLRAADTKAIFFVLGYIARENKGLIKEIQDHGHEVASHSYGHRVLTGLNPDTFRKDLEMSAEIIASITGKPVKGFRALSFSITPETKWAFDVLGEEGYEYDSSIFPARRSDGGFIGMPSYPYDVTLKSGRIIKEFPISIGNILGLQVSFSGGGYSRFLPFQLIKHLFSETNKKGKPVIAYIHPRDIDPAQPRIKMPFFKKIRTYSGLSDAKYKLQRILEGFSFCPIKDFLWKTK